MPTIPATPSQDATITARVVVAVVALKVPARADSSGKALVAIGNQPGLDQTTLCNAIALDRSTIGDVVGRLEKKGLIRRLNGSADRRTKSLHITAAGSRLIRDIEPSVEETQRLILAPLKPNERSAFMQMLKRLVHLNNEHSRAPLRPSEPRPISARERASTVRAPRQSRPRAARRAPR